MQAAGQRHHDRIGCPGAASTRYYAAADGLVVPSRWEGFGLVAIEAMRAGTAVIASDRGALPELVEHGSDRLHFPP